MQDRVKDHTQESNNAYCASANVPVPRLEGVIAEFPKAKLLHLMVVALLEQGEPMSLESIADRLDRAGVPTATGDTKASLLKAWHGLKPVYRNDRDQFALDISTWELKAIIVQLNLRKTKEPTVPEPAALEPVGDDIPLTEVEVRAAFAAASRNSLSVPRRIAAILDVLNVPTNRIAVETCLREWNSTYQSVNYADLQRWSKSCVLVLEGERLQIDRGSSHLYPLRRSVRKLAERTLRRAAMIEASEQRRQAYETRNAERILRDRSQAQQLRRAIVRIVPDKETPAAAAVLDVANRTIRTFVGPELRDLPRVLGDFDLIATLWVRDALYSLNLRDHDRWTLVDLQPPQKTRLLNQAGRKLLITPEMLLTSTTGISQPLGDAAKIAEYLASGQTTKLRRRLESDVKSLFAFYNYGVLHRRVRLRWGFLNECFAIDWAHPGDPTLHGILEECRANGKLVEIVCGSAPGWSNPWWRHKRVKIVAMDSSTISVEGTDRTLIPCDDIQAIRILSHSEGGVTTSD